MLDKSASNPAAADAHLAAGVIASVAIGSLFLVMVASVCVFKCYQKRNNNRPMTRLSAAIKKGLKEGRGGVTHKSNVKSPLSAASSERSVSNKSGTGDPGEGFVRSGDGRTYNTDTGTVNCAPGYDICYDDDDNPIEKGEDENKCSKLGNLFFSVEYDKEKSALMVSVVKAVDLPAKDPSVGSSDPYVKLQLLPDKRHKVKTRCLRKTTSPTYDEMFTFYGISENQIHGITLHFVVMSFDRFSRDDIIGEVVCPLAGLEIGTKEVCLNQEIRQRQYRSLSQGHGELLVSVCYQPAANRLTVVVLKARNLPKMDITGSSDPYVKIYLLYNGQRIAKKKTHVKKRTLHPVFNESFVFDVPYNEGLTNISLECLVLDWDRVAKNEMIGRMEIGLNKDGLEQQHWQEVINCPRKQIAEWHKMHE